MTYTVIVVDDERVPTPLPEGTLVLCTTAEGAIAELTEMTKAGTVVDELWLDYSLGSSGTIEPLLAWLIEHKPMIENVMAHSGNSSGRRLVAAILDGHYVVYEQDLP